MKSEELRSLQAPLKERYRNEPAAALVTLRAAGRMGEGVTSSWKPAGRWSPPACIRRAAAVSRFGHVALDTNASAEQIATLLALTERYCVVYRTLARPPVLRVSHAVAGA